MEMPRWLSGMMDNFTDAFGEEYYQQSYSSASISPFLTFNPSPPELRATQTCFERPTKQLKSTGTWNSCTREHVSSPGGGSPSMLSFGNSSSPTSHSQYYGTSDNVKLKEELGSGVDKNFFPDSRISEGDYMSQTHALKAVQGHKRVLASSTNPYSCSNDHIVAERKRREKLSQRFIALSAILPGLKKVDKASVLETSIRYIKDLQKRVKLLIDQTSKKPMESIVFVKKFQIPSDDDSSSLVETSTNEPLPEIKTRVSGNNVLIRIHCEKQEGVLVNALAEIEKLHLTVVSSSSTPFGTSILDITIVAQMDGEFDMAVKDFVEKLDSSFRQFM